MYSEQKNGRDTQHDLSAAPGAIRPGTAPESIAEDEAFTVRVPAQSMREMVYGVPAVQRRRSPVKAAIAVGIFVGLMGCASAPRALDVETVGQLTASTSHVYTTPVHATTDMAHSFGVVDSDDMTIGGAR